HSGKRRVDLALVGCLQQLELQAERSSGGLQLVEIDLGVGVRRIHQDGDGCSTRHQIVQERQPLRRKNIGEKRNTSDIAAWAIEASDKTEFDRVATGCEDDRNAGGRRLGRLRYGAAAGR